MNMSSQQALYLMEQYIFTDLFKEVGHPRASYLSHGDRKTPGGPLRGNAIHQQVSSTRERSCQLARDSRCGRNFRSTRKQGER
jgi:hypothetical protein